jgi:hypothetical protein
MKVNEAVGSDRIVTPALLRSKAAMRRMAANGRRSGVCRFQVLFSLRPQVHARPIGHQDRSTRTPPASEVQPDLAAVLGFDDELPTMLAT